MGRVSRGEEGGRRRRIWPWTTALILAIVLIPVAFIVVPILTHADQGVSTPRDAHDGSAASSVTADGGDGRVRTLAVFEEDATTPAPVDALREGQRLVVKGEGYDAGQGIYVGVCRIPSSLEEKPSPCLGGVPDASRAGDESEREFAPSNWINDDWAWRIFAARGYDDAGRGAFTAYLVVPPAQEDLDCAIERCAIYTRNDHTAASDRVQDVGVPIRVIG